jgi:hypothetical protein
MVARKAAEAVRWLWTRTDLPLSLPLFAVVFLQAGGGANVDLGPLQTLLSSLTCTLRRFGPYLALLFVAVGAALIIASSGRGVSYIAYGLFGLGVLAAVPNAMSGIASLFGLQVQANCG